MSPERIFYLRLILITLTLYNTKWTSLSFYAVMPDFFQIYLQIEPIFERNENFQQLIKNPLMKIVLYIIIKCYTVILSGWSLIPFVFLSFSKWWHVYKMAYFSGWIVFAFGLFVLTPLARALLPPTAVKKDK